MVQPSRQRLDATDEIGAEKPSWTRLGSLLDLPARREHPADGAARRRRGRRVAPACEDAQAASGRRAPARRRLSRSHRREAGRGRALRRARDARPLHRLSRLGGAQVGAPVPARRRLPTSAWAPTPTRCSRGSPRRRARTGSRSPSGSRWTRGSGAAACRRPGRRGRSPGTSPRFPASALVGLMSFAGHIYGTEPRPAARGGHRATPPASSRSPKRCGQTASTSAR